MQLDLPLGCYALGVDPATAAILDLMHGDPVHDRDREAVISAVRASVVDGLTSGNHWRPLVPRWCYPACVGATIHALVRMGHLVPTGEWLMSDDAAGRNIGKPCKQYRWVP